MHHVVGEEERNFQAAELHHLILHFTDIFAGDGVENRPDLALFDHLADRLFRVIRADAYQTQLADFFIDRHFGQQVGNEGVTGFRG
ncbi:hypothetical protein D3C76_1125440 [compost metagenome]